jgi:hypothetical protein
LISIEVRTRPREIDWISLKNEVSSASPALSGTAVTRPAELFETVSGGLALLALALLVRAPPVAVTLTVISKNAPAAMLAFEQLTVGGVNVQLEKPPVTEPE